MAGAWIWEESTADSWRSAAATFNLGQKEIPKPRPRNQEPRLGYFLLLVETSHRVVIYGYDKALCACDGGATKTKRTGKDGGGDEISLMPVRAHSWARLTRWPVLPPLLHMFVFAVGCCPFPHLKPTEVPTHLSCLS